MTTESSIARVTALPLPWAIAASDSAIQLKVVENEDCSVTTNSFWGLHSEHTDYRKVVISFTDVICIHYGFYLNDHDPGGRESMDWSQFYVQPQNEKELEDLLTANSLQWQSTGLSPDPRFYEIIGSKWRNSYSPRLRHFLVCGADIFLEILALDFSWQVEREKGS